MVEVESVCGANWFKAIANYVVLLLVIREATWRPWVQADPKLYKFINNSCGLQK